MRKLLAFALIALSFAVSGCTKETINKYTIKPKPQESEKSAKASAKRKNKTKPLIGFSIASDTFILERWNKDIKIFSSEIASLGGDVLLQLSAGGTEAQITQIEYLLSKDIDALVVIPNDSDMLSGVIQQAVDKQIPVIAYDRPINGVPIDAYVSFDNKSVGMLMAKALTSACPHGNYLIING